MVWLVNSLSPDIRNALQRGSVINQLPYENSLVDKGNLYNTFLAQQRVNKDTKMHEYMKKTFFMVNSR